MVADRESDIFDLMGYGIDTKMRFVFRAAQDRKLLNAGERLFSFMANQPVLGTRRVLVEQRGAQSGGNGQKARPARERRQIEVEMRAARVRLGIARPEKGARRGGIEVGAVLVTEVGSDPGDVEAGMRWLLLTTEDVSTFEGAERVVRIYETRWVVEEFHKAWKSGCRVQESRMQDPENLERLIALTAFVAIRLTAIAILARLRPSAPVETVLHRDEVTCLKASLSPRIRYNSAPGTVGWALEAIGRLGGWTDTKRIGHPGWEALARGWLTLQQLVAGYRLALTRRS
jgi:hypothetical protein